METTPNSQSRTELDSARFLKMQSNLHQVLSELNEGTWIRLLKNGVWRIFQLISWLMCIAMLIFAFWIPTTLNAMIYSDQDTQISLHASNTEFSAIIWAVKAIFIVSGLTFAIIAVLIGGIVSRNNRLQSIFERFKQIDVM
ncbi:MAG: hypothetical protein K1X61_10170 [Chitinophagales bacterium]|nr:hypothetical protein [Chitinophagales bacterium]